ncbi:AH receptor-interacting protein-like protein [Leptotrombidium deliense]|uniref:AH receptor-interacting protein-like protein n=1 Tax=Leptotrombidium deliense TaxID=299467 RepID=A0A443SSM0_9ACAR|nr:AH receptor-interacting protein-like protein [Leptotrombidium deliense]
MSSELKPRVILSPGKGEIPRFTKGTKATFHFKTIKTSETGDEIIIDDSKKLKKPMELLIDREFKLPVLEECIKSMRVNEISKFHIHKSLLQNYPIMSQAYRKFAQPKSDTEEEIQPTHRCCGLTANKTNFADLDELTENPCDLQLIVELLKVENPEEYEKEIWQMEDNEKIDSIPRLRESGNKLYNEKKYEEASAKYGKAIAIIDQLMSKEKPHDEEWNNYDLMKVPFLSNYSQCQFLLGNFYSAIEHSTEVINRDANNVKAYFRRAKAHCNVWNIEDAKKDFEKVVQLDKSMERAVLKLIQDLDISVKEKEQQEAERLKGKLF